MNAVPQAGLPRYAPMTVDDLDEVMAIETSVYEFPWTRGNLIDSLAAGYFAQTLRDRAGGLLAYCVAMPALDEIHLLNLSVAAAEQRRGHGWRLLDHLVDHGRALGARTLWLEVRPSNLAAAALYRRYGFRQVGLRRGYYPAPLGQREDAQVLSLDLEPRDGD